MDEKDNEIKYWKGLAFKQKSKERLKKINKLRADINSLQWDASEKQKLIEQANLGIKIIFSEMAVCSAQLASLLNEHNEEFEELFKVEQ